ncbi:MAG TPA: bifunctional 3-(3-hydroxy-phenyl)propionate/3-hydroxycinnamic acid hydroxylase [Ilumatobacter sp.]|nr:bifunctional 3-(3-hydroxy-phenyl)propionate/3-hydroxycinnamic acid hydroxylase [Ilumatobacter sp.]
MNQQIETQVDVIVAGGGPVGVMTGLLLARRGFTVRVLERATEIYDLPRAIVMDDEIQRVFQNAGLEDGLRAITTPLAGAEFVQTSGERIIGTELPLGANWPLGHHPNITYYQPELEAFLRDSAEQAGVELRLGVEVGAVSQTDELVTVEAMGPDGSNQTHTASWLVAADGASSAIRKQLGIVFINQGYDQDWLVLDVRLTRPVPTLPRFVQQICDPDRPTTFVVGHADYRRWEFQLQPGETRDEMVEPDRVWELLRPWLTPDDAELIRAVVYRFHATVAGTMRDGRIFIAGDAAHQMPPFLGQGLCSGIRDSANLAWKLRLVESGLADDALLDTYSDERMPHAAGVVAHAVDTGRLIDELSGRALPETGLDAAYGGNRPFPHLMAGLIHGDHPAVGHQVHQPLIDGTRLDVLCGDGFSIIVDDPDTADVVAGDWAGLAQVVVVPVGTIPASLPPGGAVIVRPDRYVAAVAHDEHELRRASSDLLSRIRATRQVYVWDTAHLEFLRSHTWAVLATGRGDGSPQQSMIGYAVDDEGRLLISAKAFTAKWNNAVRLPKVSVTVPDGRAHLVVYGNAETIDADPLRAELTAQVFGALSGNPAPDPTTLTSILDEQRRTVLRITPTKTLLHE